MVIREHRGVPVPWVAIWEGEVPLPDDHPLALVNGRVRYREETPADRDSQGALWVRNALAIGSGEPNFGQVHAARQRACMTVPRCQVCGKRMAQHTFLLHDRMKGPRSDDLFTTATPPVCIDCRDKSLLLCPHLRVASKVGSEFELRWITATDVGIWGYSGDIAQLDGSWLRNQYVHVRSEFMPRTLAKQLVLGVRKWTEEPYAVVTE